MASGLLALLDDVAALVKVTAASLDDLPAMVTKAGSKAAGVVVDDAAVTPKYVVGLSPAREIPIIWNIAKGSLKNKFLYLLPSALLLSSFAPFLITPLLIIGGLFLCYEGFEKLHAYIAPHKADHQDRDLVDITPEELEKQRTSGAIRTDFILSAEIMVIALGVVSAETLFTKVIALSVVAFLITVAVYGVVALIVKADDFGLHLAKDTHHPMAQRIGRGLVLGIPYVLAGLSVLGTAAMLWVGGGIIAHGVPAAHHVLDAVNTAAGAGFAGWLAQAVLCAILGAALGFMVEKAIRLVRR